MFYRMRKLRHARGKKGSAWLTAPFLPLAPASTVSLTSILRLVFVVSAEADAKEAEIDAENPTVSA